MGGVLHLDNLAVVAAAVVAIGVGAGDVEPAAQRPVAAVVLFTWLVLETQIIKKGSWVSYAIPAALSVDLVARFPRHNGYEICLWKFGLARIGRLQSRLD
jgi:hypothetical protein